jgi:putative transposase
METLVLRHQLRVLERQVARPQLTPADTALLAAFSRVLPRRAWKRSLLVTPPTGYTRACEYQIALHPAWSA